MPSINLISGNILNANLVRGSNLAISSSSNSANLIFVDVVNGRVGIKTNSPTQDFEVQGAVKIGNVIISNTGNINAGTTYINNVIDPVQNQDAATKKYVDDNGGAAALGNLQVANTIITTTLGVGNITLSPTGGATAIIDTTSGLVLPVGNTTQRPSPASTGTVRFNTDISRVEIYDGAQWEDVVANITNQTLYGDGINTVFTLNKSTTTASTLIIVNGVVQLPAVAYGISGNILTFTQAPVISDVIDVRFL